MTLESNLSAIEPSRLLNWISSFPVRGSKAEFLIKVFLILRRSLARFLLASHHYSRSNLLIRQQQEAPSSQRLVKIVDSCFESSVVRGDDREIRTREETHFHVRARGSSSAKLEFEESRPGILRATDLILGSRFQVLINSTNTKPIRVKWFQFWLGNKPRIGTKKSWKGFTRK